MLLAIATFYLEYRRHKIFEVYDMINNTINLMV